MLHYPLLMVYGFKSRSDCQLQASVDKCEQGKQGKHSEEVQVGMEKGWT